MKYQFDSKSLDEIIINLNETINEELIPLVEKMNNAVSERSWKGIGADSFNESYTKVMNEIDDVPLKLSMCTSFLERVLTNYAECHETVEEMIKEMQEELETMKEQKEMKKIWEIIK